MNEFTKRLISKFLEENFSSFQEFLMVNEIDETEAETIIDELRAEK